MKRENTESPELDIAGLLALKRYERPAGEHSERNIQNIMRQVRSSSNVPSLLLFPDKSFGWMFAQPRYGVAALFIIFLGLHLIEKPVPSVPVGPGTLQPPEPAMAAAAAVAAGTNEMVRPAEIPGVSPAPFAPVRGGVKPVFTSFRE